LKSFFILAGLLFAAGQCNCSRPDAAKEANSGHDPAPNVLLVKAQPVTRQDWIETVPITGSLRTLSTVDVKPEIGGRLIAVYFEEGDFVRKDQLMAEIDPVNYRLAYNQAAAALSVAEAGLERARVAADHARTEKERADNLLRTGGITEKDHQAAETAVKEAETQVKLAEAQCAQARAALAIAEKALNDCKIFAPASGHVQKRYFDRGSLLVPGVTLYTLVDNSRLDFEGLIPSYQLAAIKIGQRVTFTTPTWGERIFEGTVSAINPAIEPDNRSVKVKVRVGNPDGALRSGMYARGEIITGRVPGALVIPRDSLIPEKGGFADAVYVVREGKAHRVDIEIGGSRQQQVWVRKGLQEGDMVITEIGPSLQEGMSVKISS